MQILQNELLSKHTSLKLGGVAQNFFIIENKDELKNILKKINDNHETFNIIGHGTNLLVSDKGFLGNVLRLEGEFEKIDFEKIDFGKIDFGKIDFEKTSFEKIEFDNFSIKVGAGCNLQGLVTKCIEKGYAGIECLAGIPGSVGGAVAGNAGAFEHSIFDFIEYVEVMNYKGETKILTKNEIDFGYRKCNFIENVIICNVVLKFDKLEDEEKLKQNCKFLLDKKMKSQPYTERSAGCVFKNPINTSAGALIDKAGLKNYRIGGVSISDKHANFFVCHDNAKTKDFIDLINFVKNEIIKKYDISLELEIKYWGE